MTPEIESLHNVRIALALRATNEALARRDIDNALDHFGIAQRCHRARQADRIACGPFPVEIPDDPARVAPPTELTDDGYDYDVPRWNDDGDPVDIDLDMGGVNDFLWQTGQ